MGIDNGTATDHHNHFHITLNTPDRLDRLVAEEVADAPSSALNDELQKAAQALLEQLKPQFTLQQGDLTMFVMDVPPEVPPQYAPIDSRTLTSNKETSPCL